MAETSVSIGYYSNGNIEIDPTQIRAGNGTTYPLLIVPTKLSFSKIEHTRDPIPKFVVLSIQAALRLNTDHNKIADSARDLSIQLAGEREPHPRAPEEHRVGEDFDTFDEHVDGNGHFDLPAGGLVEYEPEEMLEQHAAPTGDESREGAPAAGRATAPFSESGEPRGQLLSHCGTRKIDRSELAGLPIPEATRTHQPLAHHQIVEALVESLAFRHITVVREEYAISPDGARMFGVLDLDAEWSGVRFSIGLRNANDKSMRLGMTVGYRVLVCDNMSFQGEFTPVLQKHTRKLDLLDVISVGVDRMQRSFAPLKAQIQSWQQNSIMDDAARLIIYRAFLEDRFPRTIMAEVHRHYFKPEYEEFRPRTLWSLSNAFTSAFKLLKPVRQFTATAKLGGYLAKST